MEKISIVLPALNEEKGIGRVLDELHKVGKSKWQVVVADGGSTDNTLKIARNKKATIMGIPKRGKGLAVKMVFDRIDCDYLVFLDADASYPVNTIPELLKALEKCDVVIGSRFKGKIEDGSMSTINKFGNMGLTLLGNALYGKNIGDMCSGMWGFRKSAYKKMNIEAGHFEVEANFFTESAKHGFKICEVPISYEKREGETKLRITDGLAIGYFLLKNRF